MLLRATSPRSSRPRPGRSRRAAAVLASAALAAGFAVGLAGGPPPASAAPDEGAGVGQSAEDPGRMVLVLDSSGSMAEPASGGGTKIEAAKAALDEVVEQLPDDAEVGARVFGATVFERTDRGACQDTQQVVPVGPLDRAALGEAVAAYEPYGETPIGNALKGAARDLGSGEGDGSEPRTIVLLSDGEPTCAPDPCKVARDLDRQGIDLTINVVGLDVSGRARDVLRCVAEATDGDYYDASSADDLVNSLVKVSVRPLRGFQLTGERIEGGTTPEAPLPVEPGRYIDTSLPDEGLRYYLVDRPEDGAVAVSGLVRPPRGDDAWNTVLRIRLLTPDGLECTQSYGQSFQILGLQPITATGVQLSGLTPTTYDEECAAADQVLVAVSSAAGVSDYRLEVRTYPAVENLADLPPALDSLQGPWGERAQVPASGPAEPVIGGVSFDDAPTLEPGTTYSDTIRPGEQLVYKVPTEPGQGLRIGARLGTDAQADALMGVIGQNVVVRAHTVLGEQVQGALKSSGDASGFYTGAEPVVVTAAVPPPGLRNAESPNPSVRGTLHGGDQYVVLGMGTSPDEEENQFAAPVRLRAELVGEPAVQPVYAEDPEADADLDDGAGDEAAADDGADAAAADEDGASSDVVVAGVVGGVAVVAVVVAVALVLRRRRAGA